MAIVIPFLYTERRPHKRLRSYIRAYWRFRRTFKPGKSQTIYPDSFYELMWVERGTLIVDGQPAPRLFLAGCNQKPITISAEGSVEVWAVRFYAWGLVPFFGTKEVFAGEHMSLQKQLGTQVYAELHELFESATAKTFRAACDEYFMQKFVTNYTDHAALEAVTEHVLQTQGSARVQDIARYCQLSPRQLERIIQKATGKTPQGILARIRFEHARRTLCARPHISLAAIAAQCGYTDQSHLVKDFQRFTNMTPLQFRRDFLASYAHLLSDHAQASGTTLKQTDVDEPYGR